MSKYKYLYEIEYLNAKENQAKFYRGSRISDVPPREDFWRNYFTSSKLVKRIIKEEGKEIFIIRDIIECNNNCNILHEEHKYLKKVDARKNPLYFNQTNNDGFDNPQAGERVCPHCYTKNYGNPFEHCIKCNSIMSIYRCKKCDAELKSTLEKCSMCGYSAVYDRVYYCKKCNNALHSPSERCSACGYSVVDDIVYTCKNCGNTLSSANERCLVCNHSSVDVANYTCKKCDSKIINPSERCPECGYCIIDDVKFFCKKCNNQIINTAARCPECGYCIIDEVKFKCEKCGQKLKSSNSKCKACGYSRIYKSNFQCKKCNGKLTSPSQKCPSCGYTAVQDTVYTCKNCGNALKSNLQRCSKCNYRISDNIKCFCKKCGNTIESDLVKCEKCGIVRAGFVNWRKYNPIVKLTLNGETIFQGYKQNCIEYLEDNQIMTYGSQISNNFFKNKIFKVTRACTKNVNAFKFNGMVLIVLDSNDDAII